MPGKKKYYVVWNGVEPGVYDSWNACKLQIEGYQNAKYKSFETEEEALRAFAQGYEGYYREHPVQKKEVRFISSNDPQPVYPSIAVDAACNMVTKVMEYRCVDTQTKREIFHRGPFPGASNNIGEFLAIVHALAFMKQKGSKLPIYSDSMGAQQEVQDDSAPHRRECCGVRYAGACREVAPREHLFQSYH